MRLDGGRRLLLALGAGSLVVGLAAPPVSGAAAPGSSVSRLATVEARVTRAAAGLEADAPLDLVLTLDRAATPDLAGRLARLGTWSWAFRHVPVAAVRMPAGRLPELRRLAGVRGVYLERPLRWMLQDSARELRVEAAWRDLKLTGKGVTVAVVDSGVDFLHPDLAPAMKANVKLLGFGSPTPVVPIEGLPDSDTTSGHGTHVAGAVAGRGTMSDGKYKGLAWGADLVGIGTGDALSLFTAVEGLDYVLGAKDELGIRIVNNSWGSEFEPFDPDHPVNVATKALADAGVVVVFAVGNDTDELTMSTYAAAPWVIPVAAGTKDGGISATSSGGTELDAPGFAFDGEPAPGAWRPLALGSYHPAVVGTGEKVISARAPGTLFPATGAQDDLTLAPGELPYYTTLSGSSQAAPEIAGVAALLLEANPALTPKQVRWILEVTARPVPDAAFWKQGYGYADASAAAVLALTLKGTSVADADRILAARHATLDEAIIRSAARPGSTWGWNDPASDGPQTITHAITVPAGSGRVKVVANGAAMVVPGVTNLAAYALSLTDAAQREVGRAATVTSPQSSSSGTTVLDVNLHDLGGGDAAVSERAYRELAWGTWTISITALPRGAAAPAPLDRQVPKGTIATAAGVFSTVAAPTCGPLAALAAVTPVVYRLQDDEATGAPYPVNPAYSYVGPVSDGTLGDRTPPRNLAGTFGAVTTLMEPVRFQTAPFTAPLTIGGVALLQTWVQGVAGPLRGTVAAHLYDVASDGTAKEISAETQAPMEASSPTPARTSMTIPLPRPVTFAKDHRLALDLYVLYAPTSGSTLFYDSDEYPSGLTVLPVPSVPIRPCGTPPKLPIVGGDKRRLAATGVGSGWVGAGLLAAALALAGAARALSRRP